MDIGPAMRKPPIEPMSVTNPTEKIILASGVSVGILTKKMEKQYELTLRQNVDVLSLSDALVEYFETIGEDLLAVYVNKDVGKTLSIFTEYQSVPVVDPPVTPR